MGSGRRVRGGQAARPGSAWPSTSRPLVAEIAALRDELAPTGVDHVVLCGMGGSSLAPEVICADRRGRADRARLLRPRLRARPRSADRLERTVVVVSSKSGGTVETDSQRRAYEQAFTRRRHRPGRRGSSSSPTRARRWTSRPARPATASFNADPDVGGRYSALTAFGLVPERAGRRRHRRAARRGRPRSRGDLAERRRRQPRRCGSARCSARPTSPASTSWSSPTPAPASPASATGPSS